jgi:D-3-phosphoglycerate dehydrogenase / 2-oxoglutarate reductase
VHIRPELWQRAVERIAAAGGEDWRLESSLRDGLSHFPVKLVEQPLQGPEGKVPDEVADADVLISGSAVIDEVVVSQLRNVRFVLRPYVGFDDIDVDGLTEQGILFANVPDAFIQEVADHTLALILACNRKLLPTDAFVRRGAWSAGAPNRSDSAPIRRISTLTLGLVGFGNIARLVAERAQPFGFRIIAADPYVSAETAANLGVELVALERVMAESDILSVHVLLNRDTRHLINRERLALMKPDAMLVNTSRGPIVDELALIDALSAGRLAGAGLDVFEVEPVRADNPLLAMPNVILTSHIASYSEEGDVAHHQRTLQILGQVIGGSLPERKVVINKALYDMLSPWAMARSRAEGPAAAPR